MFTKIRMKGRRVTGYSFRKKKVKISTPVTSSHMNSLLEFSLFLLTLTLVLVFVSYYNISFYYQIK